ncbi:MAG: hypothetical protein R2939_21490 [Kofleriaceae bacterium]
MIDVATLRLDHPATGEPPAGSLAVVMGEVALVEAAPGAGGSRLTAAVLGDATGRRCAAARA